MSVSCIWLLVQTPAQLRFGRERVMVLPKTKKISLTVTLG